MKYTENGVELVNENQLYLDWVGGEKFVEAFSSAELYVETMLDENGEEYIYKRVYDYEKVKEILNIENQGEK